MKIPRRATMKYATVDPGLVGTGVAVWRDMATDDQPFQVDVITPYRRLSWLDRCDNLRTKLAEHFRNCKVGFVYCELPEYFGGSAVGNAAAARGDVVKLTFAAAMVAAAAWEAGALYDVVEVTKWKGQLPKSVVETRIRRLIGDEDGFGERFKTHGWDAVGIGLFLGGRFK